MSRGIIKRVAVNTGGEKMPEQKGVFQSLTVWGILLSLAGVVADRSGEIEGICTTYAPSAWALACGPAVAIAVQLSGLLLAWKGRTRKGDLKGLWRK